jgi:predicted nucleic acid-binding protein
VSDFVVDASVAVKWFLPEPYEAPALRLLSDGHDLLVPDLLFVEVGNALWQRVRRAETTLTEATRTLEALGALALQVHPSQPLVALALELASRFQRSLYDSVYLAVAVLRHCPVVTADRQFYDALAGGPLRSHLMWVADLP